MGKPITDDEVRGLFSLWNNALATLDPKQVANRYAKTGVLLPTVSDTPRADYGAIEDYFVNFLKLKPQGEILESYVTVGHNWCQDVGIYEFTMGATGKKVKGRCEYLFLIIALESPASSPHLDSFNERLLHLRPRGWRVEDPAPPQQYHA